MSGFKGKDEAQIILGPQAMSDEAISVYRQNEKELRVKIEDAKNTLNGLAAKIAAQNQSLAFIKSQCNEAEAKLDTFKSNLASEETKLKKSVDEYNRSIQNDIEIKTKNNELVAEANAIEKERLSDLKRQVDGDQQTAAAAIAQLKKDKEDFHSRYEKQNGELAEKSLELEALVKKNEDLLAGILDHKELLNKKIKEFSEITAQADEVKNNLEENQTTLQEIKIAQKALELKADEVTAKEASLKASAEAQDNTKAQIQLRQESQDVRDEDLRNRERIVSEKESKLTKGA